MAREPLESDTSAGVAAPVFDAAQINCCSASEIWFFANSAPASPRRTVDRCLVSRTSEPRAKPDSRKRSNSSLRKFTESRAVSNSRSFPGQADASFRIN